ncbi:50S ribosomal protein L18 [Halalkalibacterium halodurans]|jgi:large subunit ribosomal protein L18|uniref:Large ribosomal subunit protein uL18 n=2 Tax=Halalkalibacterium halodurans TaxID=86665 RepID=RL18_HALH5|nr:50S ribosomal protein L18 [Halalkalibacterium halodurans]Q9Z9J8.1 RecName: Full=Large ribosomal subunit protein uL18; AltName: Full=50S ribosomal protein L18 [Halalkalibacterium halodurans C-125]MDY7220650.1 50S ribosomal protein L18 [Halalkalibacterium halodurans]MDY7239889.1 50S ribosomal protein L18 [Halalkalibacterium halodurans]MED3647921.1 50S ribosomal protein L18 [Halalkalibacterium halodurans]MED4081254.1 50S ribosomal protein L18 [Halalkalibacterium halodurans]MED4083969.1 50S ri
MITKPIKNVARKKRHAHVRRTITGTPERPRLNVFRSSKHIYAQLIDDVNGVTVAAASSLDKELKLENGGNVEAAKKVGELVAKRALEKGYKTIVFDRGGYVYHGRVASLADAAREAGLQF